MTDFLTFVSDLRKSGVRRFEIEIEPERPVTPEITPEALEAMFKSPEVKLPGTCVQHGCSAPADSPLNGQLCRFHALKEAGVNG